MAFGRKPKHRKQEDPKPKKVAKHKGKTNPLKNAKGTKPPKKSKAAKKREAEYRRAWGKDPE